MTIRVLEIHHHAIRIDADQPKLDAVKNFYEGVPGFWINTGANGPEAEQVFVNDPCGNMIELHQIDQCRCRAANRPGKTCFGKRMIVPCGAVCFRRAGAGFHRRRDAAGTASFQLAKIRHVAGRFFTNTRNFLIVQRSCILVLSTISTEAMR